MPKLRIATRKSRLAQIQADRVIERITAHSEIECKKVLITTKGDKILHVALNKIGGKGLFVKDIETAILEGRADAAVHSMKDVPYQIPEGFEIAAMLAREDVRDAFVSRGNRQFFDLPPGARIGTGSRRRLMQIQQLRPDIEVVPIRGNVQTRLAKIETEALDGIILAAAGLKRLGLESVVTEFFDPWSFVPAVGQGSLGLEILKESEYAEFFKELDEPVVRMCVGAERSFLQTLEGDCHTAVGAYARLEGTQMHIVGIFEISGQLVKDEITGDREDYLQLGQQLAQNILVATEIQRHRV
jgi:hydroxymethylbilane synthase